jgi:HEAT repeat protein
MTTITSGFARRMTRGLPLILVGLVSVTAYGQSTDWIGLFHDLASPDRAISDAARKRSFETLLPGLQREGLDELRADLVAIAPAFKDKNEQVRLSASAIFATLSQFRDDSAEAFKPAIPTLLTLVRDNNSQVRVNVFTALGYLRPDIPPEVLSVMRQFVRDPEARVRSWAAYAIVRTYVPGSSDQKLLESLLSDPQSPIRQTAVEAVGLAQSQDPDLIAKVRQRLSDPDSGVVREAIRAIDEIGPPAISAKDDLQKIVDANVDRELARAAAHAIQRVTSPAR